MTSVERLGEQQTTGALSKPLELEMGVTWRCDQWSRRIEEI
jgi:hypothetical protein